jgi:putative oxidoreductase
MNTNNHTLNNHGAFLLRLTLGVIMLNHGLMKFTVFGIDGTVGYFASMGLSPVIAYLTMFGEIAAGLGLISGVLTRLAAALSIPVLAGATWVHAGNGWVFSNAGGGWEFPLLLVVLAAIVTIQGAGSLALENTEAVRRIRQVVFAGFHTPGARLG